MGEKIDFAKDIINNVRRNIEDKSYNEAMEIGISNTIKALLYANINDRNTIVNAVRKVWSIDEKEIENRVLYEKKNILIEEIKDYLRFNGYTEKYIKEFLKENIVRIKLNQTTLWKFKNSPEKLVKALEKK